jgi:hypothetical protein
VRNNRCMQSLIGSRCNNMVPFLKAAIPERCGPSLRSRERAEDAPPGAGLTGWRAHKSIAELMLLIELNKGILRSYVPFNKPCHKPINEVKGVKRTV